MKSPREVDKGIDYKDQSCEKDNKKPGERIV